MNSGLIFLIHPETGVLTSIEDAAKSLGMRHSTLHGRIRRGDRGFQIWRPVGTKSKDYSAKTRFTADMAMKITEREEIFA